MVFIQRRTVAETLAGAGGFVEVAASAAQAVNKSAQNFSLGLPGRPAKLDPADYAPKT